MILNEQKPINSKAFDQYQELKSDSSNIELYRFSRIKDDYQLPHSNESRKAKATFDTVVNVNEIEKTTQLSEDQFSHDSLYQLNQAFCEKTKVMEIEQSQSIELDYDHVQHISLHIKIKDGVELEVFENLTSSGFQNINLSFELGKNSRVFHSRLQNQSSIGAHLSYTQATVGRDGHFISVLANYGAKDSRHNISVNLNDTNSNADFYGYSMLSREQSCDVYTKVSHLSPHSYSDQIFKGLLDDSSRGVFTGNVFVKKDAQEINSHQLNKNLLLSKKAHAFSQPQLEIFADDVKCSHGSTTGQLDETELFYLQQRAINAEKARQLLSKAFINEIIMKVSSNKVQQHLENLFEEKFNER